MTSIIAFDDIKSDQVRRIGTPGRTGVTSIGPKIGLSKGFGAVDTPTAFISRFDPGHFSSAHFHEVDQFQITVDGKGKLGRHDVSPYTVHFVRAHTPYGPLLACPDKKWDILVLRTRYDPGSHHELAALDKLKHMADRQPWQVSKTITFPEQGSGVSLQHIAEFSDDQGLFAYALNMGPDTRTAAPDPSGGDGQFVVVLKGSLLHENREYKGLTVVFVKPEETAFHIHSGAHGLQGYIFNMPQVKARAANIKTPSSAGFKKWRCLLCDFAYDESLGIPEEGIPAGTCWKDVPDTWSCPDCSASKTDFQMIDV